MKEDFRLPDLGEGLPEAEVVQWLVAPGDRVTLNQTIAEVETAKAVVELPSPHEGTVVTLHAAEGDVVAVGAVLISFDVRAAGAVPDAPRDEDAPSAAVPTLVGYGAAPASSGRPQRRRRRVVDARAGGSSTDTAVLDDAPHDVIGDSPQTDDVLERPRSTPPVRALARRLGVDLALVEISGTGRAITREDVEAYAQRVGAASVAHIAHGSPPVADPADRTTRTPIRGVRKHTADAMVRSAFTAPHVTTFLTVDVTGATELLTALRSDPVVGEQRIGILALAAKAVCLALPRHPAVNSRWDETAQEIVEHHYVNLGIAAATERGLVVPNVRDAQDLTLGELAEAIRALAADARASRTRPTAMTGGTFTITNVGVFGIDAGTPILNPGEAGILALGAVRRQPWEHRGEIALRDVMTLALSFDHRLVDGEQGARFLTEVGALLREPARAMLLR